ncbi:MAG: metallophosphoesterase [Sphingobacteriales bacterium]|nr:metallophosphoesterase [Sphingobacteriales bacterium]
MNLLRTTKIGFNIFLVFFFGLISINNIQAQESIRITHGPYLQAMTDNSVTIVWTTNKPATAWVELAPDDKSHFYQKERPKYFNASNGLKNVSTVHKVNVKNLKPNTRYRYRIYSQEVLSHKGTNVEYGKIAATVVYKQQALSFITGGRPGDFEFAVLNDIHEKSDFFKKQLSQIDFAKTDFVVFNGDMVSFSHNEDQIFSGFMDTAVSVFAKEIPMYYARGNHETRGPYAANFSNYFPSASGQLYYTFTRGNAIFVVLDCGEDKPDSDMEYRGITDMDFYRSEQAHWLKGVVKTDDFKKAKFKIAICHIPAVNGWHGNEEIVNNFAPILNDAGIQLMISAHEHRHRIVQPTAKVKFPIIVNSNNNLLKAKISAKEASFTIVDSTGNKVEDFFIK